MTVDCDGCMQLFHSLLQCAGSLCDFCLPPHGAIEPHQISSMLLQLDGGILLLALSSLQTLLGIACQASLARYL